MWRQGFSPSRLCAVADSPFQAAIRTVKEGMSARAGLRAAREAGIRVQDSTWFRMVGEVARSLGGQIAEVSAPLNRRPAPHEISPYTHGKATGYMQYVDVMVKDRATGLVAIRPYAVRTQTLMSRGAVITRALEGFKAAILDSPSEYDEQVLGAAYTATYKFAGEP